MQLTRLRRHYDCAIRSHDAVTFLDLAHTLRIWTEMQAPLVHLAPKFATTIAFKSGSAAPRLCRLVRMHEHVLAYMPGGARTYASNDEIAGAMDRPGPVCVATKVQYSGDAAIFFMFGLVRADPTDEVRRLLECEVVKRCNFQQWMGSEAVAVGLPQQSGGVRRFSIPRNILIKRVANTLQGSHVDASKSSNDFDPAVHFLLDCYVGGLPLPYFILLKAAQDILTIAPRLLDLPMADAA